MGASLCAPAGELPRGAGRLYILAEDGRHLPQAKRVPAGGSVLMTPAERYDFLIQPDSPRIYPVDIPFYDYRAVSGTLRPIGSIRSSITVN